MATNGSGLWSSLGTAFLVLFGLFSVYVVYFTSQRPELTGGGPFYEVFFGILALGSFAWAMRRIRLGSSDRVG